MALISVLKYSGGFIYFSYYISTLCYNNLRGMAVSIPYSRVCENICLLLLSSVEVEVMGALFSISIIISCIFILRYSSLIQHLVCIRPLRVSLTSMGQLHLILACPPIFLFLIMSS